MTPFWRPEPLTEVEVTLWQALMEAHHQSAYRPNVSSQVVKLVAVGSGDYGKAISAAVSSIGSFHAPLMQTMALLTSTAPDILVQNLLQEGKVIPGWGSSFVKGDQDPLWDTVDGILAEKYPEIYSVIDLVTRTLHNNGKKIYPNPSTYTAACALVFRMTPGVAPFLFVSGRLAAWSQIAGGVL
jgi:citrate synthase